MFGRMEEMFRVLYLILIVSVPLALWKVIDIIIWLFSNVSISIK